MSRVISCFHYPFYIFSLVFYLPGLIHLTNREMREERKMRCPDVLTFSILFFSLIPRPREYNDVTFHLHAKHLPTMRERKKGSKKMKLLRRRFPTSAGSDPVIVDTVRGDDVFHVKIFFYIEYCRAIKSYITREVTVCALAHLVCSDFCTHTT